MEFFIIEKYYRTPHLNPLPALTGRGKGEGWGVQSVIRHDFWRMCGELMYFVSFIYIFSFIYIWNFEFKYCLEFGVWKLGFNFGGF